MDDDELLDLVDRNDVVIGSVMRDTHHANEAEYISKGQYFRGSVCFLISDDRKIWIPRRQPNRKIAPAGLDFSMAEHVQSGETHLEAAVRGMHEELRLVVAPNDLLEIGSQVLDDIGCYMRVYVYKYNGNPDFNPDDYSEAWWLSLDELKNKMKNNTYKSALPAGIQLLRKYLHQK
jgi:isopentenyldiphosphate isomerase